MVVNLPESNAVIEVLGEIGDADLRKDGSKPSENQLLGRHFGLADLVVKNQMPNEAKYELEISVGDVGVSCVFFEFKF